MEKTERGKGFAQTSLLEVEHDRGNKAMRPLHPHSEGVALTGIA